jgi:hypothetical protein
MDWGLISYTKKSGFFFRPRLLLPVTYHIVAAIINLILRFSWAANRIKALEHIHPSHLVLLIELAEVFRRAMWNIFRVEWEIIARQNAAATAKSIDDNSIISAQDKVCTRDKVSSNRLTVV